MLITNEFVMLNLPKTGSTFARTVIKEILDARTGKRGRMRKIADGCFGIKAYRELILPNIRVAGFCNPPDQHGTYTQIPKKFLGRDIFSVVRNPYRRFISLYKFRHWAAFPQLPPGVLKSEFPGFPDLSLDEFVRLHELQLAHAFFGGQAPEAMVGVQTVQFIQMFFKNPGHVLSHLTDRYLDSADVHSDIAPITFLRQENLAVELSVWLEQHGYSSEETGYLRNREKVNVTFSDGVAAESLWTPFALDHVRRRERMLFRLLSDRGISYSEPVPGSIRPSV